MAVLFFKFWNRVGNFEKGGKSFLTLLIFFMNIKYCKIHHTCKNKWQYELEHIFWNNVLIGNLIDYVIYIMPTDSLRNVLLVKLYFLWIWILIGLHIHLQKIRSRRSRFLPFSKFCTLFQKMRNSTVILPKTYYSKVVEAKFNTIHWRQSSYELIKLETTKSRQLFLAVSSLLSGSP